MACSITTFLELIPRANQVVRCCWRRASGEAAVKNLVVGFYACLKIHHLAHKVLIENRDSIKVMTQKPHLKETKKLEL